MATGGKFSGSLSLSSDQVFDRNCDVCVSDDKVSEAVCYCTVCYKYYCTPCRGFHNKFHPDHRDMLVEGAAMLKTQPKRPAPVALTTRCEEHQDEVVKMYCHDHDVVCCTVCLAIKHKKCTKADYVPQIAAGFAKHADIAKTKRDLQNVKKDLLAVKSNRKNDQTRIKKDKEHVLAQVEDSRRRMNAVFDKLEEAVIREADTRYDSCVMNIQTDLKECDAAISKLEKSIKHIEDTGEDNEAEMFVKVKGAAAGLEEWQTTANRIKQKLGKEKIEFKINTDFHKCLDRLNTLGEFVDEYTKHDQNRATDRNRTVTEKKVSDVDTLKVVNKPRTVDRKVDTKVKMKKDSYTCCIYGSCCLPDGGALLSDPNNAKLKRLNVSHHITDTCSITDPRCVCYIQRSHEAAVCVQGAIKIVSLEKQMKVVRTIEMDGIYCLGVAYSNGLLYVSREDGNKLYVYDYATGQRSLTVDTDSQGKKIFSQTQHVATNTDGTRIWVADYNNGLIQLDQRYNVVRVVNTKEMSYTTGVCVDNEDNVYVCGESPNNVLQLTSSGDKVSTLCGPDELPGNPCSVSYDNKQSRLLVGMYRTDTIKVIYFQ